MLRSLQSLARGLTRSSTARLRQKLQVLERSSGIAARNAELAAWNTKVMGSALASQLYDAGIAGRLAPIPPNPLEMGFGGRLCRQEDIESPWLRHWCGQIGFVPIYHRKVWEDCYALQALHERDMMAPGRRGLGFAVGAEWLPSFVAARGAEILATDLDATDLRARDWIETDQHGGAVETIFKPALNDAASFNSRVSMRAVDMNAIPEDLHGGFDFLWSICSLEHCGSIRHGLDFVVEAMKCLRPGGVAVHTTEFNMDPDGPTIEEGNTVLFQRRHIEELEARLALAGHRMLPVDFGTGTGVLDAFVDLPPYPGSASILAMPEVPHLRLSIQGLVATSIGFIVEKGG